ncbi:hypothetical protein F4859DRAFT_517672 [Xylaria cf. heliscus]|nr:hypothetical protein F4859DRAFT_517672 [Xylaria cf. heliscus]
MGDTFNYNLFQQIYCLSFSTGIISNSQGLEEDLQATLKEALDNLLPQLTGNWAISWGPRVFKKEHRHPAKGGPDNVWFAAVDDIQKFCIVAIAGTAVNSLESIYQDLNVVQVVDFNAWVDLWSPEGIPKPAVTKPDKYSGSTFPYCAMGACQGVWNVLSNVSTEASEGMRIDQYLSSLDPSYTIVVTGHSLGGALAPIVALGLVKAKLIGDNEVKVLPSAGVSPGNEPFAVDFVAAFPKDPPSSNDYKVYNLEYYNTFDIVPQAWSTDPRDDRNLHNVTEKILHSTGKVETQVKDLVHGAIVLSTLSRIRYTPIPGQSFDGPQPPDPLRTWKEVVSVLGEEHVTAYLSEIGVTEFVDLFRKELSKLAGARGLSIG